MTPDDIVVMAVNAGANAHFVKHHISFIEAFAKRVAAHTLMNIDPSKFMSYHERNNANTM